MFAFKVIVMVLSVFFALVGIINIPLYFILPSKYYDNMPNWLIAIWDVIIGICEPLALIALVVLMAVML